MGPIARRALIYMSGGVSSPQDVNFGDEDEQASSSGTTDDAITIWARDWDAGSTVKTVGLFYGNVFEGDGGPVPDAATITGANISWYNVSYVTDDGKPPTSEDCIIGIWDGAASDTFYSQNYEGDGAASDALDATAYGNIGSGCGHSWGTYTSDEYDTQFIFSVPTTVSGKNRNWQVAANEHATYQGVILEVFFTV